MAAWAERRGGTLADWGCSTGFQRPNQSHGHTNLPACSLGVEKCLQQRHTSEPSCPIRVASRESQSCRATGFFEIRRGKEEVVRADRSTGSAKPPSGVACKAPPLCLCGRVCLQPDPILFRFENQHYLLTLCYARRTACESSPLRDRPTCLSGPRPWAGQAARRVRNVATLQWEPSAMGHLGISVHARAPAI